MAPSVQCQFILAVLNGLILIAVTTTSKEFVVKKHTYVFFSPEFYFNYTQLKNKHIFEEKYELFNLQYQYWPILDDVTIAVLEVRAV
jgi:hypothetical protein